MKISAIVPAHINDPIQLGWLKECLFSISPVVDEVIVMDDASTVHIGGLGNVGSNIKLFRTDIKQGTSRARNLAVTEAKNHLIFPLDCDDVVIPDAFERYVKVYDGTPLYPDLLKLRANGEEKRHVMMDFDCQLLFKHVITSVNVLHQKIQWEAIGGWDEEIDYIEDGEYNARLLYIYCGKRFPEPVVKYRQHEFQKTKEYANEHKQLLQQAITKFRSFAMGKRGCCGGKRPVKTSNINKTTVATSPTSGFASKGKVTPGIPGTVDGLITVKYIGGKGKGKHYIRGAVTKFNYKVSYNNYFNIDPRDEAVSPLFVKVVKEKPKAVKGNTVQKQVKKAAPKPVREAVKEVERVAVEEDYDDDIDVGEVLNQNYRIVLESLDELAPTQEEATIILDAEKQGKNRKKVIAYLERRL